MGEIFCFCPCCGTLLVGRQILGGSQVLSPGAQSSTILKVLAPGAKSSTVLKVFSTGRQILNCSWGSQIQAPDPCLSMPVWQRAENDRKTDVRGQPPFSARVPFYAGPRASPLVFVLSVLRALGLHCYYFQAFSRLLWATNTLWSRLSPRSRNKTMLREYDLILERSE